MIVDKILDVARDEFHKAKDDLKKFPLQQALLSFYSRQDQRISKASTKSTLKVACKDNCWYCCFYKVEARPIEIFVIVDFIKRNQSIFSLEALIETAKQNIKEVEGLSYKEHLKINQKCLFLKNGLCSIYPVRPSKCRDFHAHDVNNCRESYDKPFDLTIPNSYVPDIYIASSGGSEGFKKAVDTHGLDNQMYDLNSAFIEAMENPKTFKRFRDGKKAFLTAKVVQIGEALDTQSIK